MEATSVYYIKFKEKYARWLSPLDVMWESDVLDASGYENKLFAECDMTYINKFLLPVKEPSKVVEL